MEHYFHSVTLDKDKCKGCTNCIKRCPTEAIRVRDGKAKIIKERCIDCGECIRVCPYHAKKAVTDEFDKIFEYKHKIALVAPSFYAQFRNKPDVNVILTAIEELGFDDIFEVAAAAELITEATREFIAETPKPRPAISSACPAVIRLIQVRFPNLIKNLVPLLSPLELSAKLAKDKAAAETGLKPEEIGAFFITPCAAKVTYMHKPQGIAASQVDGCISMKDMYLRALPLVKRITEPKRLACAGADGVKWAKSGGESDGLVNGQHIAVDGIWNVCRILEAVENETLDDVDFLEVAACMGGCIGGPLTIANCFVSESRIRNVLDNTELLPVPYRWGEELKEVVQWKTGISSTPVMKLDNDIVIAMQKLERMEEINKNLPKLDCGSCGAPSCKALSEDIVRGFAVETDCIFRLRERVRQLSVEMVELEGRGKERR